MTERSLVLVKPDGVRRGLTGEVLRRIEAKGYQLVALDRRTVDRDLLAAALRRARGQAVLRAAGRVHVVRPRGRASSIEGERCIEGFRALAGATDPTVAAARHDPRRPRPGLGTGRPAEHRPRIGLAGVRIAGDRHLVPRSAADRLVRIASATT